MRRDSPLPLLPAAQHRREARGLADAGSAEEPPQPVRSKQLVCQDCFVPIARGIWEGQGEEDTRMLRKRLGIVDQAAWVRLASR